MEVDILPKKLETVRGGQIHITTGTSMNLNLGWEFELVLFNVTWTPAIEKNATNLNIFAITPNGQLVLTRLVRGYSNSTLADLFGVPVSLTSETFNIPAKILLAHVYDQFVKMPDNGEDWESELRGFIVNYVFLCIKA